MSATEKEEFSKVHSAGQRTYYCSSSLTLPVLAQKYCGGCAAASLLTTPTEETIPVCMLAGYIGALPGCCAESGGQKKLQQSFRGRLKCCKGEDEKVLQKDAVWPGREGAN